MGECVLQYKIDYGIWGSIFACPTALVDNQIKFCSETQLKVLLIALRQAPQPADAQSIAKFLCIAEQDVEDCFEYWEQSGVFSPISQAVAMPVVAEQAVVDNAQKTVVSSGEQKITTIHHRSKMTPAQLNELMKNDPRLPWLLEHMQQLVSRPLSPAEEETLSYLYSYLQLTPEYMLMAMEYCKQMGKCNMRYYEKLVIGWVDKGVDDHDKAEAHIVKLAAQASNASLIKSMFGISGRELSAAEKRYLNTWFDEMKFDYDMIKIAYEKTVLNTGKVAFPYINKILSQWLQKGIRTPEQANVESQAQPQGTEDSSYDIGDLDKIMEMNLNR